jgi:hypothetical protein
MEEINFILERLEHQGLCDDAIQTLDKVRCVESYLQSTEHDELSLERQEDEYRSYVLLKEDHDCLAVDESLDNPYKDLVGCS